MEKIYTLNKKDFYKKYNINDSKKTADFFTKIKYFDFPLPENVLLIVLEVDEKVVGIAQLILQKFKDLFIDNKYQILDGELEIYSLSFLTIKEEERGKGFSKKILNHIFNLSLVKKSKFLYSSYFTEDGKKYLKENMKKIAKKTKTKLLISGEGFL